MHAVYPHLQLAVSGTGMLVYVPGGDVAVAGIAWVDRQGHAEFLSIEPRVYGMLDLSDDGRRLAVQVSDNNDYILIYDVERNSSRRLPTSDSAGWPKWSPNGDALAYTSFAAGKPYRILVQSVDSDRPPAVVAESPGRLTPTTWSADGRLTYYDFQANRISSVFLPRDGTTAPSLPQQMSFPATVHDIRQTDAGSRTREGAASMFDRCQPTSASKRSRMSAPSRSGAGSAASSCIGEATAGSAPRCVWLPPSSGSSRARSFEHSSTTALGHHGHFPRTADGSSWRREKRSRHAPGCMWFTVF